MRKTPLKDNIPEEMKRHALFMDRKDSHCKDIDSL